MLDGGGPACAPLPGCAPCDRLNKRLNKFGGLLIYAGGFGYRLSEMDDYEYFDQLNRLLLLDLPIAGCACLTFATAAHCLSYEVTADQMDRLDTGLSMQILFKFSKNTSYLFTEKPGIIKDTLESIFLVSAVVLQFTHYTLDPPLPIPSEWHASCTYTWHERRTGIPSIPFRGGPVLARITAQDGGSERNRKPPGCFAIGIATHFSRVAEHAARALNAGEARAFDLRAPSAVLISSFVAISERCTY